MTIAEEQTLARWQGLTLTQYRLFQEGDLQGENSLSSMSIDSVDFVSVRRRHYPLLLVLAVIVGLLGTPLTLALNDFPVQFAMFVTIVAISGGLILVYMVLRTVDLIVRASSSEIVVAVKGSAAERHAAIIFAGQVLIGALHCRGRF